MPFVVPLLYNVFCMWVRTDSFSPFLLMSFTLIDQKRPVAGIETAAFAVDVSVVVNVVPCRCFSVFSSSSRGRPFSLCPV